MGNKGKRKRKGEKMGGLLTGKKYLIRQRDRKDVIGTRIREEGGCKGMKESGKGSRSCKRK